MAWDGTKWITNDVPDFGIADAVTKEPVPPEKTANAPFIMLPEGQARFRSCRLERWTYAGTL